MKKLHSAFIISFVLLLASCSKEYSQENGSDASNNIIGADCRISKIVYSDSASGVALGSVAAVINATDQVTSVTEFDSLTASINSFSAPLYVGDTIYINGDEYFIQNTSTKVITRFHGLQDPTNTLSPKIDVDYFYDAAGYLIQKQYNFTPFSGVPYAQVDYTWSGENMIHMEHTNLVTGDLIDDADLIYNTIAPKSYMYLFPDELTYQAFTQFLNFGLKPKNAVMSLTVNNYAAGNVLVNSSVSTFTNYTLSIDNYVLTCIMRGDDQPSIPAQAGRLSFSYKCK